MQVTPTKRFSRRENRHYWVVDTRPKGILKANNAAGTQHRQHPVTGEKFDFTPAGKAAADDFCALINSEQRVGGHISPEGTKSVDEGVRKARADLRLRYDAGKIVWQTCTGDMGNLERAAEILVDGQRFGNLPLKDVTGLTIGKVIDGLLDQQGISFASTHHYLNALKRMFNLCKSAKWILENPASAENYKREAVKHKGTREEIFETKGLERIQIPAIAELVQKAFEYDQPVFNLDGSVRQQQWCEGLAVAFEILTGLSFGEFSFVEWQALDLDASEVTVYGVVRKDETGVVEGFTKTSGSKTDPRRRSVPLGDELVSELRKWKARSPKSAPTDKVFIQRSGNGHTISNNLRKRVLNPIAKGIAGLPVDDRGKPTITWLDLRHIYASLLVEEHFDSLGIDDQAAAEGKDGWVNITRLMGHSSIRTTLNHYIRWVQDAKKNRRAGNALERRLGRG